MRFALAFLAACGAHAGSGDATFKVFYPDAPADGFHAKVGKKLYLKPVGQCVYADGRDARWAMTGAHVEGELPPGFAIEDGAISGVAKQPGTWSFKVKFAGVTCAGAAKDPQLVDVTIIAR